MLKYAFTAVDNNDIVSFAGQLLGQRMADLAVTHYQDTHSNDASVFFGQPAAAPCITLLF